MLSVPRSHQNGHTWLHRSSRNSSLADLDMHSSMNRLKTLVFQGCAHVYMACTTISGQGRPWVLWQCWWHTLCIVLACTNTQLRYLCRKRHTLKWCRKYILFFAGALELVSPTKPGMQFRASWTASVMVRTVAVPAQMEGNKLSVRPNWEANSFFCQVFQET